MSDERRTLMQQLPKGRVSPAIRQFRELVAEASPKAKPTRATQPAHEVLSVWAVRLWNSTLQGRRVVGLADLVRSLRKLSPEEPVEQVAVIDGLKTGLIFFNPASRKPIGAVVSARNESDVQRSEENLRRAKGGLPKRKPAEREVDLRFFDAAVTGHSRKIATNR
ncbi:MAG: hypothetical protein V4555_02805 [Acidobacteriota bacterium]